MKLILLLASILVLELSTSTFSRAVPVWAVDNRHCADKNKRLQNSSETFSSGNFSPPKTHHKFRDKLTSLSKKLFGGDVNQSSRQMQLYSIYSNIDF